MTTTTAANELIDKANELLDKADQVLDGKKETETKTTDIIVVLDRSGSMASIKDDMEGGFNEFIAEQKKGDGLAFVTLNQFDDEFETVYTRKSLGEVPPLNLVPRGSTALLDAVGRSICHALDTVPQENLCVFVIITDGGENASREFSSGHMKELTEKCTAKRNWQFVYMGANVDAFTEAKRFGGSLLRAANYDLGNSQQAFAAVACNVNTFRGSGHEADLAYSKSQRVAMSANPQTPDEDKQA